ncbi:MAG: hypothetical protein H6707_17230 [Deltaproteobacteria bacterium]|nr:hypothetical protein [Deltaproteobacteria bacterium]
MGQRTFPLALARFNIRATSERAYAVFFSFSMLQTDKFVWQVHLASDQADNGFGHRLVTDSSRHK